MTGISYSAHISNKKSAITTKAKLAGVAKHNLRKYHSIDYSSENINLLYGTTNLMQDVKAVYEKEFSEALNNYNAKQIREDRKIDDYFEHVSESDQDMAVEIIIQCGDKEFWEENNKEKIFMRRVYPLLLKKLQEYLPDFKIANAVVHFDEASPHMHVVGIPVGRGFKERLQDGVCWFPRLMRWKTSKGEVSPVFTDWHNEGYNYRLKSYANVYTKEEYAIDRIQTEIKSENRIGTLEQLVENIEAVEKQTKTLHEQYQMKYFK